LRFQNTDRLAAYFRTGIFAIILLMPERSKGRMNPPRAIAQREKKKEKGEREREKKEKRTIEII